MTLAVDFTGLKPQDDLVSPSGQLPVSSLARLRLLVALDALLVEGSVTGAARALGVSPPAMSRLLAQMRELFGDELMVRGGKGLVPTPFAERIRMRLRALSAEANELVSETSVQDSLPLVRIPIVEHPPLAVTPFDIEGQPDPKMLARSLSEFDAGDPRERLSRYLVTVGAGTGRSRPLSFEEAKDAFSIVLDGEADSSQVGALLMALQCRTVTANELAGLVAAARRDCRKISADSPVCLDWPAYMSPRNHQPQWFMLAARLVTMAGYRVLLHGFDSDIGNLDQTRQALGIPYCKSLADAGKKLQSASIAFLPLTAIHPQLRAIVGLYRLLGIRSPLNLLIRLLNPLGAPSTVAGAPSVEAQTLYRDAATILGWPKLLSVETHRDVAQASPSRGIKLVVVENGKVTKARIAFRSKAIATPRGTGLSAAEYCKALWTGALRDDEAIATVVATAAIGLMAVDPSATDFRRASDKARQLWDRRDKAI